METARRSVSLPPETRLRKRLLPQDALLGYLLFLPAALVLILLVAYPFLSGVWLSFTDRAIGRPVYNFTGMNNYQRLFADPVYLLALRNTAVFTITSIALKTVIGMGTALLLNTNIPARNLVRGIILLPWSIPTIVTLIIWSWMFSDMNGIFSSVLMTLGLVNGPVEFLSSVQLAMPSVIAVNVWRGFPFFTITLLAGLQSIPADLYEAAQVDGANFLDRFLQITIPGILPVLGVTALLSTIWTANDFQIIWILTHGGPLHTTEVVSTYTYIKAFAGRELGLGIAVSVSIMPAMIALIILLTRLIAKREDET